MTKNKDTQKETTDEYFRNICLLIEKEANIQYENVAYGWSLRDGSRGSLLKQISRGSLLKQIECFKAGLKRCIPNCWDVFEKQYLKESDPDYKEYLRLKNKFE